MDKEGEIASWVSEQTERELRKLRALLEKKEREEVRERERSAKRRGKNLRGNWQVEYTWLGLRREAGFRWDPKKETDVIEIALPSYRLAIEGLTQHVQSAQTQQDWVRWQIEEDQKEGKLRIICGYRRGKFPKQNPPQRRISLIFGALGFSGIELQRIYEAPKRKQ